MEMGASVALEWRAQKKKNLYSLTNFQQDYDKDILSGMNNIFVCVSQLYAKCDTQIV